MSNEARMLLPLSGCLLACACQHSCFKSTEARHSEHALLLGQQLHLHTSFCQSPHSQWQHKTGQCTTKRMLEKQRRKFACMQCQADIASPSRGAEVEIDRKTAPLYFVFITLS